jgi:hypothetical protein
MSASRDEIVGRLTDVVARELDELGVPGGRSRSRALADLLRHPVVVGGTLAVLSAFLASLVIPSITRVWQDRPRELALKRSLVEDISQSATDVVIRTRYFAQSVGYAPYKSRRREFFTARNRRWRSTGALVGAQMETYFHDSDLVGAWRGYENAISDYLVYAANAGAPRQSRNRMAVYGSRPRLVAHFEQLQFDDPIAQNTRTTFLGEQQVLDVVGEVRMISELLLYERDQLNSAIVGTGAAGFSHGFWILR